MCTQKWVVNQKQVIKLTGIIQQGRCMPFISFISGQNPAGIDYILNILYIHYLCLSWCFFNAYLYIYFFFDKCKLSTFHAHIFEASTFGRQTWAALLYHSHVATWDQRNDGVIPYPRTIVREFHELLPGCLDFLVIIYRYIIYT